MLLKFYRWLTVITGPIIDLYLIHRRRKGKEDPKRFSERLGHASFPRPAGALVWVHASSVGEAMSVLPLIRAILEEYKELSVLLTTGTVTSSSLLEGKLPPRAFHQFVPIDKLVTVRRFLDHWKPDIGMFVESELWPNLIVETAHRGCTLLLINARMSKDAFETWRRARGIAEKMLRSFALTLAQSDDDKKRLETLGATNVRSLGNLKFDAPALPADPKETGRMVSQIGERPLWLAASTHEGEERIAAEIHNALKKEIDGLLTILVPRHPERGVGIAELCRSEFQLKTALRSKQDPILETTDIYIANTIGELGLFYRLSGIAFLGGSLVQHGGQNPLEAARLECAILAGPYTTNFARIYDALIQGEAAIRVRSKEELIDMLRTLLKTPAKQHTLAANALEIVESKSGVQNAYLEEIAPYLKTLAGRSGAGNNAKSA
ncbi:MAG: 3-deoxy-D-manno-octulosonic acid transferase [Hyphomicrobiales bacterium]|nr:3-deoxy-D-manno-octulosonic acid transferase [Hyphomicrobiales bacterium]